MHKRSVTRREFCSAAAAVSALVLTGGLSPLAAKDKGAAPSLPYAVADYAAGIGTTVPLTGSEQHFVYRRSNWPVPAGRASASRLSLDLAGDQTFMTQVLDQGAGKILTRLTVRGNSPRGMREWHVDASIDNPCGIPTPKLQVKESGKVADAAVVINRGTYLETIGHENPVFALWQLFPLVPLLASKTTPMTIDLLDDGMVILPHQTLAYDGTVQFPDAAGRELAYDSYVLYGPGIEPIHFLFHQGTMPQIVTAFMRMYMLEHAER